MSSEIIKKKIAILGSTGSIGTQALEIAKEQSDKIEIIERDILLRCQSVNIEQLKNKNNMLLDSALDEKVISIEDFNENINKKLK